ncbi:MAG: hypothetical protein KC912_10770 [Proteobacteria bacterium]|nr:hypothetical protein [Pseudomonadota bacterium]
MRNLPILFLLACAGTKPTDDSGTLTCAEQWPSGVTAPDADGPDTQFHGTSAFDGEHIWMAWNRRDSASGFDIWLARLGCDGSMELGPFEVTDTDNLELDPVLAVHPSGVLVAWGSDNGQGSANLDVRYRIYDLEGAPQTDVIELEHTRGGVTVVGNVTQPDVQADGAGFLMAASRGHDDAPGFQAFGIPIDLDGTAGQAIDAQLDATFGQTEVALALDGSAAHLIWQEDSTTSTEPSVSAGVLGENDGAEVATPGARPDITVGSGGVWQTFDTDSGSVVVLPPSAPQLTLSETGLLHSPSIVAAGDGAFLVAMEQVTGVFNRLHVYKIGADGAVAASTTLATEGAPSPYGVDITAIDDSHVVVVYQDGPSPDFRLKAEWLTL